MATTVTGILAIKREISKIQMFWFNYGDKHLARINAIRQAYQVTCYAEEKNSALMTLKSASDQYPIYFMMDATYPKIPSFFTTGESPELSLHNWQRKLGPSSPLRLIIQDIIGYLCEYQHARDEYLSKDARDKLENLRNSIESKVKGDAPFFYDPINLFCEELKQWLVELSKAPMEEATKRQISARIKFLNQLYINPKVFGEPNNQAPFIAAIKYLKDIFEKELTPRVDLALSQRGAREYFQKLGAVTNQLLYQTMEFLFYVMRDANQYTPEEFSIRQIKNPTLPRYRQTLENLSGQLLQYLINNTVFSQVVSPNLITGQEITGQAVQTRADEFEMYYQFSQSDGTTVFPLTKNNITKYNWYNLDESTEVKSGVLPYFRDKDKMLSFLALHSYVEKISMFALICEMAYDLTGDVGNLMLYGCAASKIIKILDSQQSIIKEFENELDKIHGAADKYYQQYNTSSAQKLNVNQHWVEICLKHILPAYGEIKTLIKEYTQASNNIRKMIEVINHPNYPRLVQKKIHFLLECVEVFTHDAQKKVALNTGQQYPMLANLGALSKDGSGKLEEESRANVSVGTANYEESGSNLMFNAAVGLFDERKYLNFITAANVIMQTETRVDVIIDLLIMQANAYQNLEHSDDVKALEVLDKALPLCLSDEVATKEIILLAKANILYNHNSLELAEQTVRELLAINSNSTEGTDLLGQIQQPRSPFSK